MTAEERYLLDSIYSRLGTTQWVGEFDVPTHIGLLKVSVKRELPVFGLSGVCVSISHGAYGKFIWR